MKKIIFSLIVFIMFPFITLAVDYDIDHYYIDAKLLENGDMEVSELIVMDGTFNGYEVGIDYNTNDKYSASDMTDIFIGGKKIYNKVSFDTMNESFTQFEKVTYANLGDIAKYTESVSSRSKTYRMYYKTNNSTTAFLFKYTLKNVAIMHGDCVEVYWNFFGFNFNDDVSDLQIKVSFPTTIAKENFHWWFHGDLAGSSDFYENSYVLAKLKKLDAGSPVDFRVLLPKEMFDNNQFSKKYTDIVKDSIIEHEDAIVAKDLEMIKEIRFKYYSAIALIVVYLIIILIMWVRVYLKHDKERKPLFQHKYNREFIEDYNVEVIDYLMNKNITSNAMSASIMNLIYKKNINYQDISTNKKEYMFTLLNRDNLTETENSLVDFLFNTVGNGSTFSTKELKSYAKSTVTCDSFMSSYTSWKNKVIIEGKNQGFFETRQGKFKYALIVIILLFIVQGYISFNMVETNLSVLPTIAAIAFIIYLCVFTKKTEKGIEHFARWNAFKNFLDDFGTFELKELPEVVLWERYLVYATIFGLADKVEKVMNVKIKEIDMSGTSTGNVYIYNNNFVNIAPHINSTINQAYNGATAAINRKNANASGGSFGGHGGGFSSGGGFGGGGRSGGGF